MAEQDRKELERDRDPMDEDVVGRGEDDDLEEGDSEDEMEEDDAGGSF